MAQIACEGLAIVAIADESMPVRSRHPDGLASDFAASTTDRYVLRHDVTSLVSTIRSPAVSMQGDIGFPTLREWFAVQVAQADIGRE